MNQHDGTFQAVFHFTDRRVGGGASYWEDCLEAEAEAGMVLLVAVSVAYLQLSVPAPPTDKFDSPTLSSGAHRFDGGLNTNVCHIFASQSLAAAFGSGRTLQSFRQEVIRPPRCGH